MQVALAAPPARVDGGQPFWWLSFVDSARCFSLVAVGITIAICVVMALVFLVLGAREMIFAPKDLVRKRNERRKSESLGDLNPT